MPIIGLDRMPGSGLARGTLFDKELNVTEIDVPNLTVRSSLILEKSGDNSYNIIWDSPSGDDRDLNIPTMAANDTFAFLALTQTLTNKTLTSPAINTATIIGGTVTGITDLDMTSGNKTILDTIGSNTLTIGASGTTVSIPGNLTISGTTTTVNTTTLNVADNLFLMNSDFTGSATEDSGLVIERGDDTNVAFVWDESADQFVLVTTNNTGAGNDISAVAYTNLQLGTLTVANISAFTLNGKLTAGSSEIEGTAFDINGGTVDAITSLTVANNVDIGNYKVTAKAFEASDLTAGRITFAGSNGLLADDSDLTFSTDTLTATKIGAFEAAGAINFASQNLTNVNIDSGTADALTSLTIANNVDVGNYTIRANNFLADSHTATRVFFAGTDGVLTSDSDLTFATDTLTATKIGAFEAAGAINFATQNMTNVDIDSGDIANAVTINKSPTITLTGDVTASATAMTELGNVSIATTIAANSVALGTDTTGSYVATITGGTGLTSSAATSGEGTTHSLSVDAAQTQITSVGALNAGSITSGFGTIDTGSSNITTTGTISAGNLTVTGSTTTVNSTVMTVVDPIINLQTASGGGAIASDTDKDVGLALHYHTGSAAKIAFLGLDDTDSKLMYVPDASISSEVVSGSVGTIKANLEGDVTGAITGNADTATALATGRTIGMTGDVVWTSASFTGAGNVTAVATIQANAVDSAEITSGAIDLAHMSVNSVDSDQYVDASIDFAHIQNVAANSILGRNANSSGVLSGIALATTQILIGDGTGFTAAALSGDVTMTNAGAVSIGATKVTGAMLNDDSISGQAALESGIATTDELLISDGGVLKRMDMSVLYAQAATLTNKSIDLGTNTLTGSVAEFNAALQSESFATLGGTETLTSKTLTSPVLNSTISGTSIKDEDNMASNSASYLATQQSIKAYVDAQTITVTDGSSSTAVSVGGTVTFAATSNETTVAESSGTVTIGLPDDVTIGGDLLVTGDLTVSGDNTIVNTATLSVEDILVELSKGQTTGTNTDAVDVGIYAPYRVSDGTRYRGMFYDLSATRWKFFNRTGNSDAVPGVGNIVNTTSGIELGDLEVGNLYGTIATVAQTNITSVGALDGGSITSNFGTIDTGSSNITTTGTVAGGDLTISGTSTTIGTVTSGVWNAGAVTSSGVVTATGFTIGSAVITEAELEILDGATVTTTELNLIDGGTSRGTTAVASGDGILINDGGTMLMTNVDTVSTYFASHSVGGGNIVTTGALDSGSITSNFGTINTGASNITSTGTITYGSLSDGSITVTAWVDEDDMSSNSATLIPTQQSVKAYVDGSAQTMGDGFVIEDDDGTEVTLTESKEMKIIGSGVTTNWTDTSTGSDGDPYDLTITVDAAQTGITSIYATDLILGEDSQTAIDFGTANEIDFKINNTTELTLDASALYPTGNAGLDLGTSSLEFKDAFFDGTVTADAFAGPLTGNVTGTASIASTVTIIDSTDTSSYITMVDSATGNLAVKTDAGITYNAGTGTLTATAFAGPLTGNVTGNASGTALTVTQAAQTAITSLGTLTGLTTTGNINLGDDDVLYFGAGNDLQIWHDTSGDDFSIIKDNGEGQLVIETNGWGIELKYGDEHMAKFLSNGAVELYHDNTKKFETTANGVTFADAVTISTQHGNMADHGASSSYAFQIGSGLYVDTLYDVGSNNRTRLLFSENSNGYRTDSSPSPGSDGNEPYGLSILFNGGGGDNSAWMGIPSNSWGMISHNDSITGTPIMYGDRSDGNVIFGGTIQVDNINIDTNTISSTDSNGVLRLTANGTGDINLRGSVEIDQLGHRLVLNTDTGVPAQSAARVSIGAADFAGDSRVNDNVDARLYIVSESGNQLILGHGQVRWNTQGTVHATSAPEDDTVSGLISTFTAGEALSRGEVVYFKSDGKMWKAVATAAGTMPVMAMAAEDISADATGEFLLQGFIRDDGTFPTWATVGATIYAPEAETVGENVPTLAAPDSDGDFVQVIGRVISGTTLYFNPSNDVIEHA